MWHDISDSTKPTLHTQRSSLIDLLRIILCAYVAQAHVVPWFCIACPTPSRVTLALNHINNGLITVFQPLWETNLAVLAFIVLSGYCSLRSGHVKTENAAIRNYYRKKAFHILPLYWICTLAGIALFACSANPAISGQLSATAALDPVNILVKLSSINALIPQFHTAAFVGNAPLATLSIEIWLYIFYPIIMRIMISRRIPWLPYAVAISSFLFCSFCILFFPEYYGWTQNGSALCFACFWWIGASVTSDSVRKSLAKYKIHLIVGYLLLTVFVLHNRTCTGGLLAVTRMLMELRKVLFALLFALLVQRYEDIRLPKALNGAAKLGQRYAYPVYAIHAPVAIYLLGACSKLPLALVLAACIAAGIALYWSIQRPISNYTRRIFA